MTTDQDSRVTSNPIPHLTPTEIQTLIGAAEAAPSVHNTQPWWFDVQGSTIDVYADFDRALRWSIDPRGRQLVISCGAALLDIRVAAAHLGRVAKVHALPVADHADLLARVELGEPGHASSPDAELFRSIRQRHTHRRPFTPRKIPGAVLGELTEGVRTERANIRPIRNAQRRWLFDLAALAEASLTARPGYEADLARWTGGSSSRSDGIPATAFGTRSETGMPPMRDFGVGRNYVREHERYPRDPWIAILVTSTDDVGAWLRAGQALQRLLLTATSRGLAASFLNQPLDDHAIRRELTSSLAGAYPQMILRLGYTSRHTTTPRRGVAAVLRTPHQ